MPVVHDERMMTRDFGNFFFHWVELRPDSPRVHFGTSQEIEPPFRFSRVLILRPTRSKGLVLGWWRHTHMNEDDALMHALQGFGIDLGDGDLGDPEVRALVRDNVAKQCDDIADEWTIINMLGVADK